jgi:HSP20 family molecular chaperone IbpA
VVDLPAEIEAAKVTAMLKNGALTLNVPKAAQAKMPRATKIEVKAA